MKKILYILCVLLVIAGCGKSGEEKKTLTEQLYGEWHSTSLTVSGDVYINFTEAKTFELYQKMGNGVFELRRGKWNLEAGVLSGTYNDGEAWATSYKATVSDETLTLVAQSEGSETNRYKKCEIPAAIMDNCEVVVKSRP